MQTIKNLSENNLSSDLLPPRLRLKLLVLEADEATLEKVIAAINEVCGMDIGGGLAQ